MHGEWWGVWDAWCGGWCVGAGGGEHPVRALMVRAGITNEQALERYMENLRRFGYDNETALKVRTHQPTSQPGRQDDGAYSPASLSSVAG